MPPHSDPTPLTAEELAGLDEKYAKATPGEYSVHIEITTEDYDGEYPLGVAFVPEPLTVESCGGDSMNIHDAECQAALHNAYPRLRATIRAQAAEIERLRMQVFELGGPSDKPEDLY